MSNSIKSKKVYPFRMFALGLVSVLFLFIAFLLVFNLIPVDAEATSYINELVNFAGDVKTHIVDNSVFYGFIIVILISILIPAYLKVKN